MFEEQSEYSDSSESVAPPKSDAGTMAAKDISIDYRPLVLAKRGISPAIRYFMNDFSQLIPNPQKEKKFKGSSYVLLNDVAESHNSSSIVLFETRHKTENYIWFSLCPGGPTVCFFLQNVHTIEELNFIGKCSHGTRPLIFFDPEFNSSPVYGIAKQIFARTFAAPCGAAVGAIDTAISFFIADEHVWISRYQISWSEKDAKFLLLEAGPRFCLYPVLVLAGSFCGAQIYKNPKFIPPHKLNKIIEIRKQRNNIVAKPVIDPESDAKMKELVSAKLRDKRRKEKKKGKKQRTEALNEEEKNEMTQPTDKDTN